MEALIFSCIALFLHYNRKLVLFLLCLITLFVSSKCLLLFYPQYNYSFQNILLISIFQLIFIFCVSKIDNTLDTAISLFLFAFLTVVIGISYFYLPFLNNITWLLYFESRLCLEFIVWSNFTIFKSTCKDIVKQNILFVVWVIVGYWEELWRYLI